MPTIAPPIRPRAFRLEEGPVTLQWLPGEPFASHFCNVFHVFAPVLEQGFIQVYRDALAAISNEPLRAATRGLIGQEAMHARAHGLVVDAMREQGIETAPFQADCQLVWEVLAGGEARWPLSEAGWLKWRLAVGAAGEHMTGVIGEWILEQGDDLAERGADPGMLDLLRWHGAGKSSTARWPSMC